MEKSLEKLTPKKISDEIIENFETLKLSWNGITGIEFHILTLLEQIKKKIVDTEDYSYKTMVVLSKYLNKK